MTAELRREAIERAKRMRSRRAVEVLERSMLSASERGAWESSDGTVRAVDLTVLTDGFALGLVTSSPLVHDAVVEAIAEVAPRVLGASIVDLTFEWALREHGARGTYRDERFERADRRSRTDVKRALAGFLAGRGEIDAARRVAEGELQIGRTGTVYVSAEPRIVARALEMLFGAPVRVRAL